MEKIIAAALIVGTIGMVISYMVRVLREYERGVIFLLGRFWKVKGPGLIIIIPGIQQIVKIDVRTVFMNIPSQDVISRDNVSINVNAVVYFKVIHPEDAIIQVENYFVAISELAQTTLRSVLGQRELDEILSDRDKINGDIQSILDAQTEAWGIKVSNVEIKDVDINETMIRAIAKQAEAERERRAKVIHAEGELQASYKLLEAAKVLSEQEESLQLRYLQTLSNIAVNNSSTIVFPVPIDFIKQLTGNKKEEE